MKNQTASDKLTEVLNEWCEEPASSRKLALVLGCFAGYIDHLHEQIEELARIVRLIDADTSPVVDPEQIKRMALEEDR